jgi:hypothetical protein
MIFICSYLGSHPALGLPDISDTGRTDMDGVDQSIKLLSPECRRAVLEMHSVLRANLYKTYKKTHPDNEMLWHGLVDAGKDYKGNQSIGFSSISGTFIPSEKIKFESDTYTYSPSHPFAYIANRLAPYCPKVEMFTFSGATWSMWVMRRTKFKKIHGRGSGLPGDYDKYSNWNKLPHDYDPYKDYFPGN